MPLDGKACCGICCGRGVVGWCDVQGCGAVGWRDVEAGCEAGREGEDGHGGLIFILEERKWAWVVMRWAGLLISVRKIMNYER